MKTNCVYIGTDYQTASKIIYHKNCGEFVFKAFPYAGIKHLLLTPNTNVVFMEVSDDNLSDITFVNFFKDDIEGSFLLFLIAKDENQLSCFNECGADDIFSPNIDANKIWKRVELLKRNKIQASKQVQTVTSQQIKVPLWKRAVDIILSAVITIA